MAFRAWLVTLLCFYMTGCGTLNSHQKIVFEQGYRAGVKEQIKEIAAQFQGGDFPYYHWAAPIVQEVMIPAHIESGMFIPEHKELVLIKPGQWAQSPAYPIAIQENKEHDQSPSHNVSDITFMPNRVRP